LSGFEGVIGNEDKTSGERWETRGGLVANQVTSGGCQW